LLAKLAEPGNTITTLGQIKPPPKPVTRATLLRKMAGDMPSAVAVKFQGRSLASIGQNVSKRQDEKYMYQFLARQRVEGYWQEQKEKEGIPISIPEP
jgi:hypothetical protein